MIFSIRENSLVNIIHFSERIEERHDEQLLRQREEHDRNGYNTGVIRESGQTLAAMPRANAQEIEHALGSGGGSGFKSGK